MSHGYRKTDPERCPSCGLEGRGDAVLASGQRWCSTSDCRVVSYTEGS